MLRNPEGAVQIPLGTLGYFRGRNRWRIYGLVLNEFKKSDLSQAELARRMGKRPEVISRLLGAPGNWGLDTVSDILFAISGAEPSYSVTYPLDASPRNDTQPHWLPAGGGYDWATPKTLAQEQSPHPNPMMGLNGETQRIPHDRPTAQSIELGLQ